MDTPQYRVERGLGLILDDRLWQQFIGIERHFDLVRSVQAWTWTHDERSLVNTIRMGIHDLGPEHRSNDASVRSMRYSAVLADRLWSMVEIERLRVCV